MLSPPTPRHCRTTVFVAGSILVMGNPKTVAHTDSAPKAISPPSPGMPAGIVAISLPLAASTREMVPSPWFKTQTEPAPTVRNRGLGPKGVEPATVFVAGFTRMSAFPSFELTHIESLAKTGLKEPAGIAILATTRLV